jgi:hypothetical protein
MFGLVCDSFATSPDGLYVLLKPEKKKKKSNSPISAADTPKVPRHLTKFAIKGIPPETCPWSLSGPQFPQPTAIQQRYCYPKGNAKYSSRKGGALWTMYGRNGREDMEFRLLHVYFSAKRAVNKGMPISAEEKKAMEQQKLVKSTPKRRRKTATAASRMTRSPWQEKKRASRQLSPMSSSTASPSSMLVQNGSTAAPMIAGPPTRRNTRCASVFDVAGLLPPPSPCSYKKRKASETLPSPPDQKKCSKEDTIFVSPHTTASLSTRQGSRDEEDDDFSGRRFHTVSSFEEKSKTSTLFRSSQSGRAFFGDGFRNPDDRKRVDMNSHRRGTKDDDDIDQHVGASFDCNDMDVLDWNDPLLAIMMKSSMDQDNMKLNVQEDPCVVLGKRLHAMQKTISEGILANPPSEQGPLVSMVANWAKAMAKSPLLLPAVKKEGEELMRTPTNHLENVSSFAAV